MLARAQRLSAFGDAVAFFEELDGCFGLVREEEIAIADLIETCDAVRGEPPQEAFRGYARCSSSAKPCVVASVSS